MTVILQKNHLAFQGGIPRSENLHYYYYIDIMGCSKYKLYTQPTIHLRIVYKKCQVTPFRRGKKLFRSKQQYM